MRRPGLHLDRLGGIIVHTASRIRNEAQRVIKSEGHDVTLEQWAVLRTLLETGGQSQRELADRTLKDTPNITRILDILEKRGLVVRRKHPGDRRSFEIFLTGKGRKAEGELSATVRKVEQKIGGSISPSEAACVKEALRAICRNLGEGPGS